MTGGQDDAAEQISTSGGMKTRHVLSMDEVNDLVRSLDARIDELRQERDEARGVAAQLLDCLNRTDRATFIGNFPWLKEHVK